MNHKTNTNARDCKLSSPENTNEQQQSLLQFPLRFPLKVMGNNNAEFRQSVIEIATCAIASDKLLEIKENTSSGGRYLAFTIVAIFANQQEIDAVYQQLTVLPDVIMAL